MLLVDLDMNLVMNASLAETGNEGGLVTLVTWLLEGGLYDLNVCLLPDLTSEN